MMRILMLMALLLASLGWSTAATATEGAMSAPRSDGLFQGTADASEANLTALCESYMRKGFIHNDVTLYLKLLPPEAAEYEADIRKGIARSFEKKFKGLTEPSYQILEVGPMEQGEYKGKATRSIKLKYQGRGVKGDRQSRCYFKQHENGRWYLGQHP
ncbi:hypothetical protein [Shewanella baltica]|uniref:hypothetical protein n=1 Tax=Shewanella baltica TaxID=62322 RepID=UPI0039B093B7